MRVGSSARPTRPLPLEHQFGARLRRDAHDAAAPAVGRRDVKIAVAVERHALRPAQAAIEEAHFALAG